MLIWVITMAVEIFQSTHPARGATYLLYGMQDIAHIISIHAPREGCDEFTNAGEIVLFKFQSTHPARGATRNDF